MKLVKVEDLKGEEVLARDILTWDYQIILPKGTTIYKDYIEKLKRLDVTEVYINENKELSKDVGILKSEMEESIKETVKDILERHTYQNNEELAELSEAADNIIISILEEEQVVEKVFDIKQRSADIYEHSISICSLAILTALKLGVEIRKIHDIGVGCLLHDIGLRYITADFINKDIESMNNKELVEYKKHPIYGYTSLKNETWISDLSKEIILHHHERLDGSGFPLKSREIPFECKIVNICDAFDEMICGIGCRRMKVYEAIEYMKNFKNVLFDGKILNTFLGFTAGYPAGTIVLTNEGETAIVVSQNKDFQDRPVIRIMKDKEGNDIEGEVIKDLIKVHSIFIEKALD